MIPLPKTTKENYKVLLYRLADYDPSKVSTFISLLLLIYSCMSCHD